MPNNNDNSNTRIIYNYLAQSSGGEWIVDFESAQTWIESAYYGNWKNKKENEDVSTKQTKVGNLTITRETQSRRGDKAKVKKALDDRKLLKDVAKLIGANHSVRQRLQLDSRMRDVKSELKRNIGSYNETLQITTKSKLGEEYSVTLDGPIKLADAIDSLKQRKARIIENEKTPSGRPNEQYVGIELELFNQLTRTKFNRELAKLDCADYIHVKSDGSISLPRGEDNGPEECECSELCADGQDCSDEDCEYSHECDCGYDPNATRGWYGHEVTAIIPVKELEPVIRELCAKLTETGCDVNKSCGFHVHLDARPEAMGIAGTTPQSMYERLCYAQDLLIAMQPKSRQEGNHYCMRNTFNNDDRDGYLLGRADHRYRVINGASYRDLKTIEVRVHSGTINANKILNWISLLHVVAHTRRPVYEALNHPITYTAREILAKYAPRLSPELYQYVQSRLAKFSPTSVDWINPENRPVEDTHEMSEVA